MITLTNKGGKVRASGEALEALKALGWVEEVTEEVASSPAPAPKPRAKRATKKSQSE